MDTTARVTLEQYRAAVRAIARFAQSSDERRRACAIAARDLIREWPVTGTDPITVLPGIGSRRAGVLSRLGWLTVEDAARHLPIRYEDRRASGVLGDDDGRAIAATVVSVTRYQRRVTAVLSTPNGPLRAVWLHRPYLAATLRSGDWIGLWGRVQPGKPPAMIEPELAAGPARGPVASLNWGRLVPVYPITSGATQRQVREVSAVCGWLVACAGKDPLDEVGHREARLPAALVATHFPRSPVEAAGGIRRLQLDRAVGRQLWFSLRRRARDRRPAASHLPHPNWNRWLEDLPVTLTPGQAQSLDEIISDLARPRQMNRLLLGDVGSGKTLVAASAACWTALAGAQAAVLCPTDLVAVQHRQTFQLLERLGIRVGLLTGGIRPGQRSELLQCLASGDLDVVIGTHAVLASDVQFMNLGLVIIDEQHRFGVRQRQVLLSRGARPDLLMLTATPIPRTVALSQCGHLDVSRIPGRLPGRTPGLTEVLSGMTADRLDDEIRGELASGGQAFVVCPRLDADDGEVPTATAVFRRLLSLSGGDYAVELLHGRMDRDCQRDVVSRFGAAEVQVLVTTTVIEVGIDLPSATLIVVLGAERFGLAQLHQLRGRVGRGERPGRCLLVATPGVGVERLQVLERTDRGLAVAMADLRSRGPGELPGTRQSGRSLPFDPALERLARQLARRAAADAGWPPRLTPGLGYLLRGGGRDAVEPTHLESLVNGGEELV